MSDQNGQHNGRFPLEPGNHLMMLLAAILLDMNEENKAHIPASRIKFIKSFEDRIQFDLGQHPITGDIELALVYTQPKPDIIIARN